MRGSIGLAGRQVRRLSAVEEAYKERRAPRRRDYREVPTQVAYAPSGDASRPVGNRSDGTKRAHHCRAQRSLPTRVQCDIQSGILMESSERCEDFCIEQNKTLSVVPNIPHPEPLPFAPYGHSYLSAQMEVCCQHPPGVSQRGFQFLREVVF